uniref:Uncharacterized protein n=1 Tax=Arundo donax TaxID=35708 RepID=A0A0A8ZJK3_ARUDO
MGSWGPRLLLIHVPHQHYWT